MIIMCLNQVMINRNHPDETRPCETLMDLDNMGGGFETYLCSKCSNRVSIEV